MDEGYTERLRRAVQEYIDQGRPMGVDNGAIGWLSWHPVKVREAIFLILDGYLSQDHRAHVKGAQTARARKKR